MYIVQCACASVNNMIPSVAFAGLLRHFVGRVDDVAVGDEAIGTFTDQCTLQRAEGGCQWRQ